MRKQLSPELCKIRPIFEMSFDKSLISLGGLASLAPRVSCFAQTIKSLVRQVSGNLNPAETTVIASLPEADANVSSRIRQGLFDFKNLLLSDLSLPSLIDLMSSKDDNLCIVSVGSHCNFNKPSHEHLVRSIRRLGLFAHESNNIFLTVCEALQKSNKSYPNIIIQEKSGKFINLRISEASEKLALKRLQGQFKSTSSVIDEFDLGWAAIAATFVKETNSQFKKIRIASAQLNFLNNDFQISHLDYILSFLADWTQSDLKFDVSNIGLAHLDSPSICIFNYMRHKLIKSFDYSVPIEFDYRSFYLGRHPIRAFFDLLNTSYSSQLYLSISDFPRVDVMVVGI